MATDRWSDINRLFHEAAPLPPDERAAFLDRACSDDDALRCEVESLLRHHDAPAAFLDEPALAHRLMVEPETLLEHTGDDPLIGRTIGAFRIDRHIAGGGMGSVYHAVRHDEYFSQEVAIKLLHRSMDHAELRRRFKIERDAQANLNHPNIARLQDAGVTHDGLAYLVMEYIDGQPINDYCDERRLPIATRLKLFQTVCSAVHFAHQNLVVHRDLKPSNILVTKEGTAKLVDFGIAKVLAPTDGTRADHTETVKQMVSVDYASPEQITGDPVTTETDIYSLGVILYEMLAGSRPYRLTSHRYQDIEQTICVKDPRRPSTAVRSMTRPHRADGTGASETAIARIAAHRGTTSDRLARVLRGDLDNIIMMAMRKEPHRRYASAQQFAEDIQRYLDGHPVLARRDTPVYRVGKFVRRNRMGVGAAALVAVSMIVATVMTARQARIASDERDVARAAEHRAEQEAVHARIEANSAQQVADFLADALLNFVSGRSEEHMDDARQLLDRQVARVRLQFEDQPHLRANLLDAIGHVHMQLHLYDDAEALIDEAAGIRRDHFGTESLEWARSLNSRGELDYVRGRYDAAVDSFREALALQESLPAGVHTDVALALNNLAATLRSLWQLDEAESLHLRALELRQRNHGESNPLVAESLNNLAGINLARGNFALAQSRLRQALSIRQETLGESHPLVAQTLSNLATAHLQAGEYDEAEAPLRQAIALYDTIPNAAMDERIRANRHLAYILQLRGEYDEAEQVLETALAAMTDVVGADHLHVSYIHESLASLYQTRGDLDAAGRHWMQTRRIRQATLPPNHPGRLSATMGYGVVVMNTDSPDEALPLLQESHEGYQTAYPSDDPHALTARINLAVCLLKLERFSDAEPLLREAVALTHDRDGQFAELNATARRHLDHLYDRVAQPDRSDPTRPQ